MQEAEEHDVQFVEAGEDSPEALESAKKPLDFVAAAIEHTIVFPRLQPAAGRWNDGNPSEVQSQLPGLIVRVGAIHEQGQRLGQRPQAGQQIAALRGVVRLAG